jgi:TolB-like protein
MSFWGELKRRNVFKVGVAYAIVAWLLVQIANTFFPIFNMPGWTVTLVASLLVMGLPVALILAWAYEMTPEGVKLTKKVPLSDSITHVTGRKLNYVLAGLIIVLVGYIVIDKAFIGRSPVETVVTPAVTEPTAANTEIEEAQKTIAVLPFADMSPEKDQEYFVDGLSEEILNSLTKIQDLRVIARTSSFSFKGTDKKIQEIADELGANHILEGSVRKAGNELRITAQLVSGIDGSHLWSKTYDRKFEDIFVIQEDIASAVAEELKISLGVGKSLKQLGVTDNPKAYELYLIAKGQYNKLITIGPYNKSIQELALESLDSAIALDSEFALAWASKSIIHTWLLISGPANRVAAELNSAMHAAQNAIELAPDMAAGYYALGYAKSVGGDFIGARLAYSNALDLSDDPLSFIQPVVPIHYNVVGYFEKAKGLLGEMLITDPLNIGNRGWYNFTLIFIGDTQRALEENKNFRVLLFEDQQGDFYMQYYHLWTGNTVNHGEIDSYDTLWGSPDLTFKAAMENLDSPKEAIEIIRKIYADQNNLSCWQLLNIGWWSTYFDDPEFAMEAIEEAIRINPENIYTFYFPLMKEFRQMPRFKELIKEVGLIDYWNQFGWPDICHKLDTGDFVCD